MKVKVLYSPYKNIDVGSVLEVKVFNKGLPYPFVVYRDSKKYTTAIFAEDEVEIVEE